MVININKALFQNDLSQEKYQQALNTLEEASKKNLPVFISDNGKVSIPSRWVRIRETLKGWFSFLGYVNHTSTQWIQASVKVLTGIGSANNWNTSSIIQKIQVIASKHNITMSNALLSNPNSISNTTSTQPIQQQSHAHELNQRRADVLPYVQQKTPPLDNAEQQVSLISSQSKSQSETNDVTRQVANILAPVQGSVSALSSAATQKEPSIQPLLSSQKLEPISYDATVKKANAFHQQTAFPQLTTGQTAIEQIQSLYSQDIVKETLQSTRPLVHKKTLEAISDFLDLKKRLGSSKEQKLYETMTTEEFIDRLLKKRPVVFWLPSDNYLLKGEERQQARNSNGAFDNIGRDSETPPLILEDYLSYDEMVFAAQVGVSVKTRYINDGDKENSGEINPASTHEEEGICIGLVGARFERPEFMEYQFMMITPNQNTEAKGYGPLPKDSKLDTPEQAKMRMWAKFYGISHFPTYQEAVQASNKDLHQIKEGFINKDLYKKRISINIEMMLTEANLRAQNNPKGAYVQPYGWGLSAWTKHPIQKVWFLEAFEEAVSRLHLPHVADVDFSFTVPGLLQDKELPKEYRDKKQKEYQSKHLQSIKGIKLHYPTTPKETRQLCSKLRDKDDEGKLLINSYGWDGNSYPGNEYWLGHLSASGDPAMMCASPLQVFAQTPDINPYVCGNNTYVVRV